MKKVLFIFLIFCFSLNIISCSSSSDEDDIDEIMTTDTTAATLAEVTFVTTPTNDSTPDYTFSSDEAGIITYGGSCSSGTTSATSGNNTITLVSLSDGTYSNCTIIVTDSAGNASSALSVSTFVVDTTAPSVSSFTLSDTALITGDNATVTLVFSEAVASFSSSADITVANGTLAVMTSTDNITWAGTFTPTANTEDDNNTLSLATSYTDTAGNTGPAATTLNYVIETTAPTVSSISTTADNQSSVSITDNITVTFSEAMEPSYVTTSTSDTNCAGSIRVSSDNYSTCVKMSSEPVSSNSNRTFTLDPYDNLTVGSTYLTRVTTGVKDTAGNAMSSQYDNSTGFAIVDLTAPTVSSVSTTADNQSSVAITDNITVTFSEAMDNTTVTTNTDNTTCYGSLELSSDNFSSCVQMSSAPASSSDNMTFTLDPYDNLTGGTTYKTRVTTGVKDTAGNALSSQYETSSGFTTLLPAPDNLSASGANNTIILTWNSVSGATSYTLYWDNVSGIDSSDTAITSITNDNYTDSNKETNYALDFDGTNDYVSANGVATELDSSTNLPLSVSAWVYPENGTKEQLVFGFYKNNAFANGPSVWFGGSNYKFAHWDSITTVHSSSTYAINNWHHVVLTIGSDRDGVLYVNGSSAATFSGVFNSGGLDMFSIAVDYDSSGGTAGNLSQYFDGKIDEVAVWNVALNAADVTALYNSGNGLKASANSGNYDNSGDLVGYWKFNEGTGSTLTDNTSNSNNGTLTNMDSSDWVTSGSETKPSFQ